MINMEIINHLDTQHIPAALKLQGKNPQLSEKDERGFRSYLPPLQYYETKLAEMFRDGDARSISIFNDWREQVLEDLIKSLGRAPTPAELERELERQKALFDQPYQDTFDYPNLYLRDEVYPQLRVISSRSLDFPQDPEEWPNAPARIETVTTQTRSGISQVEKQLIITTSNQKGGKTDHPVMTTAESQWVSLSADVIADHTGPDSTVFIGGLGLGILNEELDKRGVGHQVIGEINTNVISLVAPELQKKSKGKIEIRNLDYREILKKAIANGEQFDVISIDAFPNTAKEINRDASSKEVLMLAFSALKPGGMLTFYPDSRYLPYRILSVLRQADVPFSCIHYNVAEFDQSNFTEKYHYGKLMAVPCILKPRNIDDLQMAKIKAEYYANQKKYFEQYLNKLDQQPDREAA